MARPREFDEQAVLDAAIAQFWSHGYASNSVRDLATTMGMTGASVYNAFGDKRAVCPVLRALRGGGLSRSRATLRASIAAA